MKIRAFIGYIWKSHRALILFSMVFIAGIQGLLIYFNSTLEIAPMMELLLSQLPGPFTEMYGDEILSQISAEGTIAFGLEHPLVITLIIFIGISMVSRNISTSSDNKQMEIILAHPFKRQTLIASLYLFSLLVLACLIFAAFLGATLATYFFHTLDAILLKRILLADLNAWLLHVFILTYTLFLAVWSKDITRAIRISAILAFLFYFINIISDFFDFLEVTKYINYFSYFDPARIMTGKGNVFLDMTVLAVASMVLFVLSFRAFVRKDIA